MLLMSAALRHRAADITYRQANLQLYCSQHIVLTTWVASQVQPSQYIYSCPASTSLSWKSHMADTMSKHLQGWSCEGVRQGTSMQCVKRWGWGGEGEDEGMRVRVWGWGGGRLFRTSTTLLKWDQPCVFQMCWKISGVRWERFLACEWLSIPATSVTTIL